MKLKTLKKGSVITIIGKRWFDKIYGNTYHSVKVLVNGDQVGYIPFTYGYGDMYEQNATEILWKAYKLPEAFSKNLALSYLRHHKNGYKVNIFVSDVQRKKDLTI